MKLFVGFRCKERYFDRINAHEHDFLTIRHY